MEYTDEYSFARPYLGPGESILWKGKPGKGHLLTAQDAFLIPFSIVWCGFAIFWEGSVLLTDGPFIMKLWGIPFVLMGPDDFLIGNHIGCAAAPDECMAAL